MCVPCTEKYPQLAPVKAKTPSSDQSRDRMQQQPHPSDRRPAGQDQNLGRSQSKVPPSGPQKDVPHPVPAPRRLPDSQQQEQQSTPHQQQQKRQQLQQQPMQQHQQPQLQQQHHPQQQAQQHSQQQLQQHPQQQIQQHPQQQLQQHPQQLQQHQQKPLQQQPLQQHSQQPLQQHPQQPLQQHPQQPLQHQHQPQQFQQHPPQHHHQQRPPPQQQQQQHPSQHQQRQPQQQQQHIQQQQLMQHGAASGVREAAPPSDRPVPPATLPRTKSRESSHQAGLSRECPPTVNNGKVQESAAPRAKHQTFEAERPKDETAGITTVSHVPEATRVSDYDVNSHKRNGRQHARSNQDIIINTTEEPHKESPPGVGHSNFRRLEGAPGQTSGRYIRELKRQLYRYEELASLYAPEQISRKQESQPCPDQNVPHPSVDKIRNGSQRVAKEYRHDTSGPPEGVIYQQQLTQPQTMAEDSTTSVPTHQDSISRRKLPVIDKGRQMSETPTRHEKSKKDNQEQQMPSETVPSSIHHAPRTSMPESVTYEDRVTERRDGQSSLPRTVPLTSLNQTLQQQQVSHPQPKEQQLVQQQAQIVKQRNEQQQLKQRSGLPQQPLNEQQLKQLSQQQVYEAAQKQQQQQNQQLLQKQSAPQQQHFQQQQQQMKQTQEQFYMQQNQQHFKQQVVGSEAHHIQSEVQFKQQQLMRHLQQANQIPQRQQPPPPPVHPMQEQQPLRYPVDQSQKHQISQQQNKQQSNQQYPVPSVQQQGLQRQGEQYRQQQILPQNLPSDRQQALRRQEVPQETQVTPYQQVPKLQNQNMIQREVISSQLTYQKQQDRKACTNPFLIMSETEFDEDKVKKSYANGRSGAGPIVSEQTRTKLQSDHDADNILSDTVVKDSVMHRAPMTGKEEPQLIQDHRKGKPLPPKDVEQDLEEYQDEEEEEDIDDYFQLIENAIGVRKPQVIPGGKKSSEIQKQLLMTKETAKGSSQNLDYNQIQNKGQVVSKQMDIYNQQQQQLQHKAKQNRVNHVEEVKSSGSYPSKHISQYDNKDAMNEGIYEELNSTQIYHIRQPPDSLRDTKDKDLIIKKDSAYSTQPDLYQRSSYGLQTIPEDFSKQKQSSMMDSAYGGTAYDKYLKHELMADNTQPSVKHYLEEHKTKPIPYEVFSSTKALQSQQRVAEASENGIDIYRSQPSYTVSQMGGKEDSKSRSSQGYGYSGENVSYQVQRDADIYDPNKTANQQIPGVSAKPNNIDLQGQKKPKPKPDPQDWSPVSDLSPIMDVSPSVEAAEQELMEKYREKDVQEREEDDDESRPLIQANIPRATSGTISGMLEEFNRALGLPGSSPVDDSAIKTAVSPTSLAMSPISAGSSITSMSTVHQQEGLSRGVVPQKTTPQHPTQVQHGSPVKTVPATSQPGTPRRSHRRLPQPTMEQMQMAVAMAAQGPKERASSQESVLPGSAMVMEDAIFPETTTASTSGITSPLPSATSIRPVSPMMPWKTEEITQTFEQAFKHQTRERSSSLTEELKDHHAASSPETSASVTRPYPIPAARTSITTTAASTVVTGTTLPSSIYGAGIPTTMSATSTTDATYNNIHSRRMKPYNEFRTSKSLEETTRSSSPSLYVSTNAVTEIATTEGSPQTPSTPREKGGDSSDTQSEAESIKSVRMRRKLPTLPPDARSSPSPTRKTLERNRTSPAPSDHEQQGEKEQNHEGNHQVTESDILSSVPSSVSSQLPPTTSATVLSSASAVTTTTTTVTTATSITVGLTTTTAESTRLSPNPNLSPSPLTRTHSPSRSPSHLSSGSPSPSRRADLSPAMSTPGAPSMRTPSPLSTSEASPKVADSSSSAGSKLPQYMQTLKQQLRDELKAVTEERKVMMELKHKDRDLVSVSETVSPQPPASSQPYQYSVTQQPRPDDDNTIMTTATTTVVSSVPQRYEIKPTAHRKQSYPTSTTSIFGPLPGSTLTTGSLRRQPSPRTSPQASPKKGRRRHTSEITMPPYSPMREALEAQSAEIAKIQAQHQIHRHQQQYLPHQLQHIQQQTQVMGGSMKSLEFESLDGHVRGPADIMMMRSTKYGGSLGSGLGPESVHHRGLPIKTAVPGFTGLMADQMEEQRILGPDAYFQTLNNEINRLRRSSEAIQDSMYDMSSWDRGSPQTTDRRKRKEKKPKKPRSWHPSPYVSEDEDDQMTREEKKAKIKAEIARRRQQIEENTRLHEELYKLARRRDRSDHMANTPTYKPSPTEMIYSSPRPVEMPVMSRIPSSMSGETQVMLPSDDTSSVLKAIDEILRKDLYSGPMSRVSWANYNTPDVRPPATAYTSAPSSYVTMPRTRYDYKMTPEQESRGWYTELSTTSPTTVFPDCSAEDESIARIASTFPTDDSAPPDLLMSTPCATFDPICEFSPVTTDTETPTDADATPAMPLLPDMPTRSRKLLENLGSSPIVGQPARSSSSQSMYQERLEPDRPIPPQEQQTSRRVSDPSVTMPRPSRRNPRMPVSKTTQKYDFPVKRILLTRDPKDRSVSGNGLGMKVVGGKEVPGTNGIIGAYVAKIFPGGVVETLGEVKEGDQVIEWNGIPLTGKTYEEVQRIIASSSDEVEIVIRCDLNMLETDALSQQRRSPGLNMGCPGGSLDPPDTPGSGARTSGTSPAQSPYSPVGSSRGHSPALTKRMMGGGGGGGSGSGTVGGGGGGGSIGGSIVTQGSMNGNCLSNTSSYDNLHSPEPEKSSDYCLYEYTPSPLESATTAAPIGQGESGVVTLYSAHNPQTWSDIYPSPPRSTDDDDVKDPWLTENSMDEVQVGFGPRAAIVYVPIIPVRPLVAVKENGYITQPFVERTSIPKRSMDHIPDKHPLLRSSNPEWKTSELQQPHLGVKLWNYDLLPPKNSVGKVSLYLNGLKDNDIPDFPSLCKLQTAPNGFHCPRRFVEEIDNKADAKERANTVSTANERPRAPQDLPGLKPVFVNDWKKPKKSKDSGNDDNNNNNNTNDKGTKKSKPPVGSSPEATPYHILPKGCRGSFCVLL